MLCLSKWHVTHVPLSPTAQHGYQGFKGFRQEWDCIAGVRLYLSSGLCSADACSRCSHVGFNWCIALLCVCRACCVSCTQGKLYKVAKLHNVNVHMCFGFLWYTCMHIQYSFNRYRGTATCLSCVTPQVRDEPIATSSLSEMGLVMCSGMEAAEVIVSSLLVIYLCCTNP